MQRSLLFVAGFGFAAVILAIVWPRQRSEVGDAPPVRAAERGSPSVGAAAVAATPTPLAWSTPRPVTVRAVWDAAAGAEPYSEGRFPAADLRYGERFYIERVCVSDARKLTMISYRDSVGHTDVPLALGQRGVGRVDPADRNCTLFGGIEAARVEKCKCWFQCAGEQHQCTVSGVARRP